MTGEECKEWLSGWHGDVLDLQDSQQDSKSCGVHVVEVNIYLTLYSNSAPYFPMDALFPRPSEACLKKYFHWHHKALY